MKTIISIFGTRPEVIKMAPVIKELEKHNHKLKSKIIVTAQHRDMLDQYLNTFDIIPDYDLDIMQENQSLTTITVKTLSRLESIFVEERPNLVLVQGDTTTAFAASLAAFYQKIRVGHIEAGLRTYNRYEPYPEEQNRNLISLLSSIHFAPTPNAKRNLMRMGVDEKTIHVTGNTVIDTLFLTLNKKVNFPSKTNLNLSFDSKKLILVTAHRRENFGKPLENICHALKDLVKRNKQIRIIYPVHKNPAVHDVAFKLLAGIKRISLVDSLDYPVFVNVMAKSYLILTDSGGIQEEAPSLGKPVLVVRNETERPEAIEAGTAKLIGVDRAEIIRNTETLLNDYSEYKKMANAINPYGDGNASPRIVGSILTYLG
jgi:UDP-N-acetylglucosamine 2-epimerase (non-hydrolysing)